MNQSFIPVALNNAHHTWRDAMRGEGNAWIFIAKALLALYMACWISMRLELPSPATAMITVLIVMNPQTGMVLAKGFYRGLGTLIGCVAGVVMVALLPQQPLLLLLVMALWSGGMAAGALLNRNMRAYSFVLGGYTVAMVVLPSVNNPAAVLDNAIWRLIEVGVGLLVAGAVFDIVLPTRHRESLQKTSSDNCEQFLNLVRDGCQSGLKNHAAIESSQQALVRGAVSYEDLRSIAIFDDPSVRASSSTLTQLNQRFMAAVSRFQSLHHLVWRLQRRKHPDTVAALISHLSPLAEILTSVHLRAHFASLHKALQTWYEQLDSRVKTRGRELARTEQEDYEMGAALLLRFAEDFLAYVRLHSALAENPSYQLPRSQRENAMFMRATDPIAVLIIFLRTSGTIFLIGLFWMTNSWSYGGTALLAIAALLTMLAAAPNPVAVARQLCLGHLVAPIIGLLCYSILPLLTSFPLLVLGTLPFMVAILYIYTRPTWAPFGMALGMGFMVALMLPLSPVIDAQRYLNEAVAIMAGVCITSLGFILVPSVTGSRGQRRRLMYLLRQQVRQAASLPLRGLSQRFESRNKDILLQVNSMTRAGSLAARRMQDWTLLIHETGATIIDLRNALEQDNVPRALNESIKRVLDTLGHLYGAPAAQVWHQARQQLNEALVQTPAVQVENLPLRQLLLQLASALDDGDSVLARSVRPNSPEVIYAP